MADTKETKESKSKPAKAEGAKAKSAAGGGAKGAAKSAKAKPAPKADSKFAGFITSKKLDPRRIIIASRHLEARQPEDRLIRLNKRLTRKAGDAAGDKPKETRKPRSGRPVTGRAMNAALGGGKLSGPTKTRILRAVNHLLEQKKQEKAELKQLF
jgi:hypothetical protein